MTTQIITPKFSRNWHVDVAYAMEEQLRKILDAVIEKNRAMKSYFILVVAYPDPFLNGMIRQKIIHGIPPEALRKSIVKYGMLGSILYWRDNEHMDAGEMVQVWVLPRDVPIPEELLSDIVDNPSGKLGAWNVEDDGRRLGMPILLS